MGLLVKKLNKSFNNVKVVNNVSFEMKKPSALGLVGVNGAGKTTTIRMIIDILKKESGSVIWNGEEFDRDKIKIGYLPEERGIYPKTRIKDQLIYFAKLKGLNDEEAKNSLNVWSKKFKVEKYLEKIPEELSKGNQQKVQLLTVFMHNPDLIILDEPLSGLDPINAELIKNLLNELIKKGKYIIITSHQMNIIEDFCSHIVMLKEGKVIMSGNIEELKDKLQKNILIINGEKKLMNFLKEKYDAKKLSNSICEIELKDKKESSKILEEIVACKYEIEKFEIRKPTLREIFIDKAGDNNE